MLVDAFRWGLWAFALVSPLSIALSGIAIWPLLILWIAGAYWTFPLARPVIGPAEKAFLFFLLAGIVSAALAVDPTRGFRILFKKEAYFLIAVLLSAWLSRR